MSAPAIDEAVAAERPRLVALAYRMLGSMSDAQDVVQDALLKARAGAPDDLESPAAYLTTVTTRTAIDHLRSARVRRESYVGPWLPEPLARDPAPDVSAAAELADSLSLALLVVLESLTPHERAALLLHDVFAYSHTEIAGMLGTTQAASRQLLHRAREHVEASRPRFEVDRDRHEQLVRRFIAACEGGGLDDFVALVTDDVVHLADAGGAQKAARHPIRGTWRVTRLLAYVMARRRANATFELVHLAGGQPAIAVRRHHEVVGVLLLEPAADGRASVIHWVLAPEKLADVRATLEPNPG
jgi:RNA polymerase sigma-70 factor (ECF subfamily)